jgi:hypothetical protein
MDGRWRNAKRDRGFLDRQQLALGRAGGRLEAGNVPVAAQIADAARDEAVTICRARPLPIEDAGDHAVGVMSRQAAHQCDRVLISADGGRPRARQGEIDPAERAALPAQREMGRGLVALDLNDDFFEESAQQLLAVARRGRGRLPDGGEIGPEREEAVALCLRDHPLPLPFAALEIGLGGFERPQALFPIAVRKWLKAGLLEEEVVTDSDKGTGQGSVAKLRGGSTRIRRLAPYFINRSASAVTPTRKPKTVAKVRSKAISSGDIAAVPQNCHRGQRGLFVIVRVLGGISVAPGTTRGLIDGPETSARQAAPVRIRPRRAAGIGPRQFGHPL